MVDGGFARVAFVSEFEARNYKIIELARKEIVILHLDGQFYAVDNLCPHRQAPLSTGAIENDVIICPWHEARFDLKTGKGLEGPHRADIGCYRVKVVDGGVWIDTNSHEKS